MTAYGPLRIPDPQEIMAGVSLTVRSFDVVHVPTGRRLGGVRLTEQAGFRAVPSGQTLWTLEEAVEDVLDWDAALQARPPRPPDACQETWRDPTSAEHIHGCNRVNPHKLHRCACGARAGRLGGEEALLRRGGV